MKLTIAMLVTGLVLSVGLLKGFPWTIPLVFYIVSMVDSITRGLLAPRQLERLGAMAPAVKYGQYALQVVALIGVPVCAYVVYGWYSA